MAIFLVLLGGFIGLICGLVALFLFHTSILIAIAIWSVIGVAITVAALFWLYRPKPEGQGETITPPGRTWLARHLF